MPSGVIDSGLDLEPVPECHDQTTQVIPQRVSHDNEDGEDADRQDGTETPVLPEDHSAVEPGHNGHDGVRRNFGDELGDEYSREHAERQAQQERAEDSDGHLGGDLGHENARNRAEHQPVGDAVTTLGSETRRRPLGAEPPACTGEGDQDEDE